MRGVRMKKHPFLMAATIIGLLWFGILIVQGILHQDFVQNTYNQAMSLTFSGQYDEAASLLDTIIEEKYMDTASLRRYCNAQIDYANGDYKSAHMNASSLKFSYLSEEQDAAVLASVEQIDTQYEINMEQERIRQQAEYEHSIRTGVPFVGMPESCIADTSLGAPSSKIRHNNQVKSGEIYRCNLYDFYINGHLIFTARCMEGRVIQVWDSRDKVNTSIPYPSSPSHSSSAHSSRDSDPYHAADYSDEEDFYEDHWDDFFDFEDAEDYWREHHS